MEKFTALIVMAALSVALGLVAAFGWYTELTDHREFAFVVSMIIALAAPALMWAGGANRLLVIPALVFMVADGAQTTRGYNTFDALTRAESVEKAEVALDAAQARVSELPTPDANGAIRRVETYETALTALTAERDRAEEALETADTPRFDERLVFIVLMALQASIAAALFLLGRPLKPEMTAAPVATRQSGRPDISSEDMRKIVKMEDHVRKQIG